ncbi:response regulator transcription factor [Gracilibacillus lacisalsi]|uniref:response regulator transcription factor n=1 Tax=Gracilibacillus lacisalsi TaxID=393087 RepID=UPI0003725C3F|nr:response regulator [Gracilibacillus lacisalsi]
MYKVLLVDDERMILDGISVIVDWNQHDTSLIGKAMNGLEAYDFITKQQPDIVITDITMPGLDGIELVKKAKQDYPSIKWIFLSGFSEFEYARQAMRFGVKHYLLKPCNEVNISEALDDVVQEIREEEEAVKYMKAMEEEVTKNTVNECEEVLKQFFIYEQITEKSQSKMKQMVEGLYSSEPFFFWMLFIEGKITYDQINQLIETINRSFLNEQVVTTLIENKVVVMMRHSPAYQKTIKDILQAELGPYTLSTTSVFSKDFTKDQIEKIPTLDEMVQQVFYQPKHSDIPSQNWIHFHEKLQPDIEIDLDTIVYYLKKQQKKDAVSYLIDFVDKLKKHKVAPKITRGYFIQIYLLLMSKLAHHSTEDRVQAIGQMEDYQHISDFVTFFEKLFERMIIQDQTPQKYSKVVRQMLTCIEEEIENPALSLQWLANHCLYMNADYLGKTFKKEIGQRFSSYVTNARINKAVEIIEVEQDIKVFELAERLGFGNNPQYFSQIFKRMKGFTPSEIIKSNEG